MFGMRIYINGEARKIDVNSSVFSVCQSADISKTKTEERIGLSSMLGMLGLKNKNFIIELNGKLVLQKNIQSIFVYENDKIELMQFIGGG